MVETRPLDEGRASSPWSAGNPGRSWLKNYCILAAVRVSSIQVACRIVREEDVGHPTGQGAENIRRQRDLSDEKHRFPQCSADWPLWLSEPHGLTAKLGHRCSDRLAHLTEFD